MQKYEVIKDIIEGFNIEHPYRYSNKVIAKKKTILIGEKNYSRIGDIIELKKQNGDYVCDLDSLIANECCVRIE